MSVIKLPSEPVILTNKEHSDKVVDLAGYDASGTIIGHSSKAGTNLDNENQKVCPLSHPVSSPCSSSNYMECGRISGSSSIMEAIIISFGAKSKNSNRMSTLLMGSRCVVW